MTKEKPSFVGDQNWEDIHEDFGKEELLISGKKLQKHWENKNFTYEQVKEWKKALEDKYWGEKLQSTDYFFCSWLRDTKQLIPQEVNTDNIKELREEYNTLWKNICGNPENLGWLYCQHQWEKRGLTYQEAKFWIDKGLTPNDYDFAYYLKKDGYQTNDLNKNNLEELKKKVSWQDIHENFTLYLREQWEKQGLGYQETKQWIELGFEVYKTEDIKRWKKQGFNQQQVAEWIKFGLGPNDFIFANYLRWKNYQSNQDLNLKQLREEFNTWLKNSPAQEWLDCFHFLDKKKVIKALRIKKRNFTGTLDLSDFVNLEELDCSNNKLTSLKLDNCKRLKKINCSHNRLTGLSLVNCVNLNELDCRHNQLTNLDLSDSYQLEFLDISNNNLSKQDLSAFSKLINLKDLWIGNDNKKRIKKDKINRFYGNLEELKNLSKLEVLHIDNTDINDSLDSLPSSIKEIYCSSEEKATSEVKKIEEQLKENNLFFAVKDKYKNIIYKKLWKDIHLDFTPELQMEWKNRGFNREEAKEWIDVGLKPTDADFACWLVNERYTPEWVLNCGGDKKLREEYKNDLAVEESENDNWRDFDHWKQEKWKKRGFVYKEVKKWIDIGFEPKDLNKVLEWRSQGFAPHQVKAWIDVGLKPREVNFASYLKQNNYQPSKIDLKKAEKEYYSDAQEDEDHSLEQEKDIERLDFNDLNLNEYNGLKVYITSNTQLRTINKPHYAVVIYTYRNSQEHLNQKHPYQGQVEIISLECLKSLEDSVEKRKNLHINDTSQLIIDDYPNLKRINQDSSSNSIFGTVKLTISNCPQLEWIYIDGFKSNRELILNNLPNLEWLNCSFNQLASLNLSDCPNLRIVDCPHSFLLSEINLPLTAREKLQTLNLKNSNFPEQDLSLFSHLINLRNLYLGNSSWYENKSNYNRFQSSLEPLKNLIKLEELDISNTDIDSGLEYLPSSLKKFACSAKERPRAKCQVLEEELRKYGEPIEKEDNFYEKCSPSFANLLPAWKKAHQEKTELTQQIQTLQKQQSFFQGQEIKINYLEIRIQELTNLIKIQKEKIVSAFLRLLPEKELLKELITIHLEFIRFKEWGINSSEYGRKCREYNKHCEKIKDQLWDKLSEEEMNKIEAILKDCENLIRDELELETKLNDKTKLIENQKQTLLQITSTNEEKFSEFQNQLVKHKTISQKEQEQLQEEVFANNYLRNQLNKIEELVEQQNLEQVTQIQINPFNK